MGLKLAYTGRSKPLFDAPRRKGVGLLHETQLTHVNTRQARVKATAQAGSLVIPWDHSANYARAATQLYTRKIVS